MAALTTPRYVDPLHSNQGAVCREARWRFDDDRRGVFSKAQLCMHMAGPIGLLVKLFPTAARTLRATLHNFKLEGS